MAYPTLIEFMEGKTGKLDFATACLITAAVNACQAVNPKNPLAVAGSIPEMYRALRGWAELWNMRPLDSGEDMQAILKRCWIRTELSLAKAEGKEEV